MEEEFFFSGFCRAQDATRTVTLEDGFADCDYPACVYRDACTIARQMDERLHSQ